jgi:anti-anti-sigma regulatory factor
MKASSFVIEAEHVALQVDDIRAKLATEGPEILLDFFLAQILDPPGIQALEELAAAAHVMDVKVMLRGVNVEMYKVLKLAGLADRFGFLD